MGDQAECPNSTGNTCSATRCECNGIVPEEMQSLEQIKAYQKSVILQKIGEGVIKRHVLRDSLPFYLSDRRMRKLIAELVKEKKPIQSSSDGYQIILSDGQLLEAQKYFKSKAFACFERARDLHQAFYKDKSPQLSIESFLNTK